MWLLRAQPYDEAAGNTVALYFSDNGYINLPTEAPANQPWHRRIEVPLALNDSLFAGSNIGGASEISYGDIVLANDDGALDAICKYQWDGRQIDLWYARDVDGVRTPLANFQLIFSGTCDAIVAGNDVKIPARDLQVVLDKNVLTRKLAGTGGAEGPASIKDTYLPTPLGWVQQYQPQPFDAAYSIFSYADGPCGGITDAFVQGNTLYKYGGDFSTYDALKAAVSNGWEYITCTALGFIRYAETPKGTPTVNIAGRLQGGQAVANPSLFRAQGGWVLGAGWAYDSSGAGLVHTPGNTAPVSAQIADKAGAYYALRLFATMAAGSVSLRIGGVVITSTSDGWWHTLAMRAAGANELLELVPTANFDGTVRFVALDQFAGTFGEIAQWLLLNRAGLTGADLEPGIVASMNGQSPLLHEIMLTDTNTTVSDVLNQLASSIMAYFRFNNGRQFTMGLMDKPKAVADVTYTERDMYGPLVPKPTDKRVHTQVINYRRFYTTLATADLAGATNDTLREQFPNEFRKVEVARPAVQTASLLAVKESLDTTLWNETEATAVANSRLDLFSVAQEAYTFTVDLDPNVRSGMTARLMHSRYGLTAGKNFVILRVSRDPSAGEMTLEVWGI